MTEGTTLDDAGAVELLSRGTIDVQGRLVGASNVSLLAHITLDGVEELCVYKPVAGERPLWDFPEGTLAAREASAYVVSAATGWDVVPPTILREGPFGPGSVQLWIETVTDEPGAGLVDVVPAGEVPRSWRRVLDAEGARGEPVSLAHADDPRLARMAVLDAVINNADRKGGHVLRDAGGSVWGVDHGVCFNVEPKLRTVLWGWAGRPLPQDALAVLRALATELDEGGTLARVLGALLAGDEVQATRRRVQRLLSTGRFPRPTDGWPTIPWPPF